MWLKHKFHFTYVKENYIMKKLLSVVLASILALSLVGCGGSDDKITIAIPNDTTN